MHAKHHCDLTVGSALRRLRRRTQSKTRLPPIATAPSRSSMRYESGTRNTLRQRPTSIDAIPRSAELDVLADVVSLLPVTASAEEPVFRLVLRAVQVTCRGAVVPTSTVHGVQERLFNEHWHISPNPKAKETGRPYTVITALASTTEPTAASTASSTDGELLTFLIKRYKQGRVSGALCAAVPRQMIHMSGPFVPRQNAADALRSITVLCAQVRPRAPPSVLSSARVPSGDGRACVLGDRGALPTR